MILIVFTFWILDFSSVGGMGGQNRKTEPSFFAKMAILKKVNSQTFFAILSKKNPMHKFLENGGRPKSTLADLLLLLSTQN